MEISFDDEYASQVTITLPEVSVDEVIEVQVTVSDGLLSTTAATSFIINNKVETITVTPEPAKKSSGGSVAWILILLLATRIKRSIALKQAA